MSGYYDGYGYGHGPFLGAPNAPASRRTLSGKPATMSVEEVHRRLVAFLRNLDADGAAYEDVTHTLLYVAVMEAAESGYSARAVQDLVAGLLAARRT